METYRGRQVSRTIHLQSGLLWHTNHLHTHLTPGETSFIDFSVRIVLLQLLRKQARYYMLSVATALVYFLPCGTASTLILLKDVLVRYII